MLLGSVISAGWPRSKERIKLGTNRAVVSPGPCRWKRRNHASENGTSEARWFVTSATDFLHAPYSVCGLNGVSNSRQGDGASQSYSAHELAITARLPPAAANASTISRLALSH